MKLLIHLMKIACLPCGNSAAAAARDSFALHYDPLRKAR
jgi:hypothetical protein